MGGFSPTAVAQMRNPSQSQEKAEWDAKVRELMQDFSHQHHLTKSSTSLRRLGTTALTVGITTVGVVALVETLVQIQIFVLDFHTPKWLFSLFALPYVGLGTWGCGMDGIYGTVPAVMCDIFLGSLALNTLEYLIFGLAR